MTKRLLVVDDDVLLSMIMIDMLEDLGFEVSEANSAQRALEIVRDDPAIDVMLTDLHMPGTDGYRLAALVRDLRPDLPVILVTGGGSAFDPRFDLPVLSKPYTRKQLISAIEQALLVTAL